MPGRTLTAKPRLRKNQVFAAELIAMRLMRSRGAKTVEIAERFGRGVNTVLKAIGGEDQKLQLGAHGYGVLHRCPECGSKTIGHCVPCLYQSGNTFNPPLEALVFSEPGRERKAQVYAQLPDQSEYLCEIQMHGQYHKHLEKIQWLPADLVYVRQGAAAAS